MGLSRSLWLKPETPGKRSYSFQKQNRTFDVLWVILKKGVISSWLKPIGFLLAVQTTKPR